MLDEALATQMLRAPNTLERATFLMRMCTCSMAVNIVFAFIIVIMAVRPVDHLYFWTTGDGTIRPLVPLTEPVLSDSERAIWITQSVTEALAMDFTNFRTQLQKNRTNFTVEGFEAFNNALQNSGIMGSVISYKYVLSAVPTAAPVQVAQGNLPDGRFAWQYQLPLMLTYQSSERQNTQAMSLQLVVVRVKQTDNARGMAISRFEAR